MESLDLITRTLGNPRALWRLQGGSRTVAAIVRWRHGGAVIDLSGADAYQVVFNVSGGQVVEWLQRPGTHRNIRAGSIGIHSPLGAGVIRVQGQADTLQILISLDFFRRQPDGLLVGDPSLTTIKPELQAAAVQALVAVENRTKADQSELERIIRETAECLLSFSRAPARRSQGGLSPGARRRVDAIFQESLTDSAKTGPRVQKMANAAGLSLCHFIRSYRGTEGQTPHARLLTLRLDRALELLLQTESPVSWISDAIGFSSPSHFVSTFRQHLGITPGTFRQAARRSC